MTTERPESTHRPPTPGPGLDDLPSYDLVDLTWAEAVRVLAREPRLVLAVGALEQHGRHLPLGTNCWIAKRFVETLSETEGVLRAPPFWYGVNAPSDQTFAGTASLTRKTLHRALNELVASWERHGVEEFILVTLHRHEPHVDALLTALTATATLTVVNLYDVEVSDLLRGPSAPQHAGEIETALLLHLAPERVRRDEIRDFDLDASLFRKYVRGRLPTPPPGCDGAMGRPSLATAETGRRLWVRFLKVVRERIFREEGG